MPQPLIAEDLRPGYDISIDLDHNEVHQTCRGLWTVDTMRTFQADAIKQASPIVQQGKPFRSFADLSSFVTQIREVGDMMTAYFELSAKFGLERVAVVNDSALFRLQYRRVIGDIEAEFFSDRVDALKWLRQ